MDAYLWHCKLGHMNKNRMNRLNKKKIFEVNDYELLSICESYLLRKMTKSSFTEKDEWASDVLSLLHTDVCGPINMNVKGRYYYFIIFTDDLLR